MYKPILKDSVEIAEFIVSHSPDPIDRELVLEYFDGCMAILKTIKLDTLKEGDCNQNLRDIKKELKYKILPIKTTPPLIVENYVVADGNHRLRIAKERRLKELKYMI